MPKPRRKPVGKAKQEPTEDDPAPSTSLSSSPSSSSKLPEPDLVTISSSDDDEDYEDSRDKARKSKPKSKRGRKRKAKDTDCNSSSEEKKKKPKPVGKIEEVISSLPEENRVNLTCPECTSGKKYTNEVNLYRHIKLVHKPVEKPYTCLECEQAFRLDSLLKYHIERVHSGLQHPCPYCPKVYSGALLLTFHMRIHTGDKLKICPHPGCEKRFPIKRALEIHMETHKPNTKEVICQDCGKAYRDKHLLYQHQARTHKEAEHECEICERRFIQRSQLRDHMELHSDERPFRCVICFKKFKLKPYMWNHFRLVHKVGIKEAKEMYEKNKDIDEPLGGPDFPYDESEEEDSDYFEPTPTTV